MRMQRLGNLFILVGIMMTPTGMQAEQIKGNLDEFKKIMEDVKQDRAARSQGAAAPKSDLEKMDDATQKERKKADLVNARTSLTTANQQAHDGTIGASREKIPYYIAALEGRLAGLVMQKEIPVWRKAVTKKYMEIEVEKSLFDSAVLELRTSAREKKSVAADLKKLKALEKVDSKSFIDNTLASMANSITQNSTGNNMNTAMTGTPGQMTGIPGQETEETIEMIRLNLGTDGKKAFGNDLILAVDSNVLHITVK